MAAISSLERTVRLAHDVEDGHWERAAEIIRMLMPERPPPAEP
jgi:hypothetical protein